jgi:hypothetical protein
MGLSLDAFREALPELVSRGFPRADETTGNFDLDAIDAWRCARRPHHFSDRLDLCENPPRSPVTTTDASGAIRQNSRCSHSMWRASRCAATASSSPTIVINARGLPWA